ncbi:MAG: hypothetical protein ISS92_05290 [Candidatus Omnitrophica bacterium]|nr:hypothetical protein [Candidatus Omnitrophota bacterium]
MKRFILYLSVLSLLFVSVRNMPAFCSFHKQAKNEWVEHKSDHFLIYYKDSISPSYIKQFTRKCEQYYDVITERLGFNRFDFWLWEDRAKIFLYSTHKEYVRDAQRPTWSGGLVHVRKKTISTFYGKKDFFDTTLPHELAHIILREFIGMRTRAPLWFDEGVACVNEKDSPRKYLLRAKKLVDRDITMTVPEMEKITSSDELIIPSVFYSMAASLMIFLLEDYKKKLFVKFCKELKEKNNFYKAMKKVYGIENAEVLNTKFLAFLKSGKYNSIMKKKSYSVKW